ncbi:MAG TPA: hypothetical protein PKE49_02580 [Leptospiraceae bacterium]|nr:hypothetical protein [Leptospirales bacterium]HMU81802.1 hypothetical protein [Leptospiraceae bacterium]HMW58600.1 hypothetical protein [Leptospiraceae bacterium]HMX55378.1 hypothetical protein [Leptospiraceae bacterium]HMY45624.1 hypothetical protein [Leptospiraceae bacterium]
MKRATLRIAFIIASMSFLSAGCGDNTSQRVVRFKDFRITQNPTDLPAGLPAGFRYPDARAVLSAGYEPESYASSQEGSIEFESRDDVQHIEAYYNNAFREQGWKVIQSRSEEKALLLMAESAYSEVVTVIARSGPPSRIRVYMRRLGRDG